MNYTVMKKLIDTLRAERTLDDEALYMLYKERTAESDAYLYAQADAVRREVYGNQVYLRGLIEISNICKNDCRYCGIRRSNDQAVRYRLDFDDLMACCEHGYALGFRTFVLQGGEDGFFTDDVLVDWVDTLSKRFPDCALTLSLGERSRESYERLYEAGARRYLLRHETATDEHYRMLHPKDMSLAHRLQCLRDLKEIGYQTGCGIMVGSPGQTWAHLLNDLRYMQALDPQMVGLGPFIPAQHTPFAEEPAGTLEDTLWLLAVVRLMLPHVLLPATTALATLDPGGREAGLKAGANVLMPNLSPLSVRKKYSLYDNKATLDGEAAENVAALSEWLHCIGYEAVVDRGDYKI
ncbi:MAG: [FeFe] hydrogenase H-cluster radical SAM maturase HydE [Peptococcaceae bacterium]|nr:[FeFe] hydrogenase H-cluster radical SAM maturase HydE [Peptococcaceae bacterium]